VEARQELIFFGYVKKWHVGIRAAQKIFLECVKKHD